MAIDKIIPIRLDKSSDFKLVPTTSMVDALNMLITENESSGEANETGNLGVLKNIKGNDKISYLDSTHAIGVGDAKIIGSVTDTKLKIVYFFVWHTNVLEHGVYAYDQMGKLPISGNTRGKIVRIHKSDLYAFPEHGYVKGNIIYTSQTRLDDSEIKPGAKKDFEKDAILYFIDNTNEPRKLNVYQAMLGEDSGYLPEDKIDFITACPKTPLTPITSVFNADTSKTTSNFKSGPGFQFAYQFISKDGVESAISPYSDIAFSPGIINQGASLNVNHNLHNRCMLTIPNAGAEIESIRILARQFNNPELVILDEVSNGANDNNWNYQTRLYSFYNDRIVRGVSNNEVNKQFDNLPRKAQAQAVVDNRLMYGNYLEGFDNVKPTCSATVTFEPRGVELINLNLKLVPAVSEQSLAAQINAIGDGGEDASSDTINKSAGYIIDPTEIPQFIDAGTTINVTLVVAPEGNFHIYQAANSYHQSRHKGGFDQYGDWDIDYSLDAEQGNYDGWNAEFLDGEYGHQSLDASGAKWITDTIQAEAIPEVEGYNFGIPYAGNNLGVGATGSFSSVFGNIPMPVWKTKLGTAPFGSTNDMEYTKNVVYGTSAGNPLVLKGGTIEFSISLTFNEPVNGQGQNAVVQILSDELCGIPSTWGGDGFITVNSSNITYEHNIDAQIEPFSKHAEGSPASKLITGVMEKEDVYTPFRNPIGYFAVNKAKVIFSLEKDSGYAALTGTKRMIRLVIDKIEAPDGEDAIDVISMVKKQNPGTPWIAISKDFFTGTLDIPAFEAGTTTSTPASTATVNNVQTTFLSAATNTIDDFDYRFFDPAFYDASQVYGYDDSTDVGTVPFQNNSYNLNENLKLRLQLGYLEFIQTEDISQFFRHNKDSYSTVAGAIGDGDGSELFQFSLLDGEGGPGGFLPFDTTEMSEIDGSESQYFNFTFDSATSVSSVPGRTVLQTAKAQASGGVGNRTWVRLGGPRFLGAIDTKLTPFQWAGGEADVNNYGTDDFKKTADKAIGRSYIPLMQGSSFQGLRNEDDSDRFPYSYPRNTPDTANSAVWPFPMDFSAKQTHIEVQDTLFAFGGEGVTGGDRTFKSSANHDFGIIYYDERGRHGFVNHLKTVYVPGYSQQERGVGNFGKSVINLLLDNTFNPPEWAHYYKLAYTKNTSVQNFIQYSAGGAFPEIQDSDNLVSDTKIYVSLNYLQESPISYVADWGARNPQGGLSMFKAIDGVNQKLRVISAYTSENTRDFYYNYEFDIVDVVLLGDSDNPISTSPTLEPWTQGEFVVLKNNQLANGFDYTSVIDGNSFWNNNCIVELYTPQKSSDDSSQFYYEIGDTYNVLSPGASSRSHSESNITLDKGDVWWRRVPVNFREYNEGEFQDLIQVTDDIGVSNPSKSNFESYYLETETASDLFKADATLIGRPNIIVEDAVETIREASITYSGQSNPNSSKINYSSFNLTLSNFKELQEEFGDINYMCNMEGDVFVIQSDRCTLVPASKTLFSDVQGSSTVAASKSPLGQERVFAGRAGCDNNPESVVQVGAYVYFAHKNLGKVYRFNPSNGVQEISEQGMASYFRGIFKDAMDKSVAAGDFINYDDVRVVGGFDPVNEEYLLTVLDPVTYGVTEGTGGGGMGEEGEGGGVEDLTTINSLEQQLKNVMEAFLTAKQADGVTPAFDITTLPQELQDFYNTTLTDGKDIGVFDGNENDVFDTGEIVSMSDIQVGVQDSLNNFLVSELDITLEAMVELINRADVTTTEDVLGYTSAILQEFDGIDAQFLGAIKALNNSRQSKFSNHSLEAYAQYVQGANNPYFASGFEYYIAQSTIFNEEYDAVVALIQAGDYGPEFNVATEAFFAARDAWYEESGYLDKPTRQNVINSLTLAARNHASLQYLVSGNGGNINFNNPATESMNRVGLNPNPNASGYDPETSTGYSWGVANTGTYINALSIKNNTDAILSDFKVFLNNLKSNRMSIGGLTELEAIQEIVPEEFLSSYVAANATLEASLLSVLGAIAINANNNYGDHSDIPVAEVTGAMLEAWALTQAPEVEGEYNSLAEAISGAGISISQLRDLRQQIALAQGVNEAKIKSDFDNDYQVDSGDLLIFLSAFGETVNVDYNQNYTNLNLS